MSLMRTKPAGEAEPTAPVTIEPDAFVAAIVNHYPQTLQVFTAYGFTPLKSALTRKTAASPSAKPPDSATFAPTNY